VELEKVQSESAVVAVNGRCTGVKQFENIGVREKRRDGKKKGSKNKENH
jgi:hypothetical protein